MSDEQIAISQPKPWMVLCCGCGRLLVKDGTAINLPFAGGVISTAVMADFATPKEADEFAASHGWQVNDTKGPNHRCPECRSRKRRGKHRGAYVTREWVRENLASLLRAGEL